MDGLTDIGPQHYSLLRCNKSFIGTGFGESRCVGDPKDTLNSGPPCSGRNQPLSFGVLGRGPGTLFMGKTIKSWAIIYTAYNKDFSPYPY